MVVRSISKLGPVVAVVGLGLLGAGCGGANAERRATEGPLLAAAPSAGHPVTDGRSSAPRLSSPLAEQMARDPGDRVMYMERMRRQILHKTRHIPQQRYSQQVRPDLRRQLVAMGFDVPDADRILSDVDHAR